MPNLLFILNCNFFSFIGLTFTERWNTDNTLGTEIAIQDQIAKGLKLSFDSTFAPQTGHVKMIAIYVIELI